MGENASQRARNKARLAALQERGWVGNLRMVVPPGRPYEVYSIAAAYFAEFGNEDSLSSHTAWLGGRTDA